MTSFYKTLNKSIYPISKFRYPNKYNVSEKWSFDEMSLVCRSFQWINGSDDWFFDFIYYEGDHKSEIREHLEGEIMNFFVEIPNEQYVKGMEDITHWTVTFNNCEKWGNCDTVEYCEVTPTYQFKQKRKNRQRLIFFYDQNKNLIILNSFKDDLKIDPKTHTPLDVLITDKDVSKVENINLDQFKERLKDLSEQIFVLNKSLIEMKNI